MQICWKWFAGFSAALLVSGCGFMEKPEPQTAPVQPEKVVINVEASDVAETPKIEVRSTPKDSSPEEMAKQEAQKRQAFQEQERAKAQKTAEQEQQERDQLEGAFVGDLNDTERNYLQEVREKNRRSKEASHSKIFGGSSRN